MKSWKEMIDRAMKRHGETWLDVEYSTLTDEEMHSEFYTGFGAVNGEPFTVWTAKRVYFPAVYDGSEWVGSVSRNPDGMPTDHIGG